MRHHATVLLRDLRHHDAVHVEGPSLHLKQTCCTQSCIATLSRPSRISEPKRTSRLPSRLRPSNQMELAHDYRESLHTQGEAQGWTVYLGSGIVTTTSSAPASLQSCR